MVSLSNSVLKINSSATITMSALANRLKSEGKDIISLSAGGTIQVKIFQTGGGTVQLQSGQDNSWFAAYKLIGV